MPSSSLTRSPRAVLFDFDGTLGDCYTAITASVNHVRAGHSLPPLAIAEVLPHVGRGPVHLLEATVGSGPTEANVAAYQAHHPSVLFTGTKLLPGAMETLHALHVRGLLLGVCSNKPVAFTRALLAHFQVATYVAVVLGPEDVARPKPAPDMLLAALTRLQIAASDALYVGDMTVDVESARAAGVAVWVVPTGSDEAAVLTAARPDRVLQGLSQIPSLLGIAANQIRP